MPEGELKTYSVLKADAKRQMLFGFGIVCKTCDETGRLVPYFDNGSDSAPDAAEHISEEEMLKATTDFMANSRAIEHEHHGPVIGGQVLYGFPLTEEIAKALGITTPMTGFLIGVKPDDPEIIAKALRGEIRGFSMFGTARAEAVA